MAIISGEFDNVDAASQAVRELIAAGVPANAIDVDAARLRVATDVDHAGRAMAIINAHGKAATVTQAEVQFPGDQVNERQRFVTENRDTSRDPDFHRDDVEIMDEAIERHPHPKR